MLRVVFMGTPDFAVPALQTILALPNCQVVGVWTQPDRKKGRGQAITFPPVKQVALEHGLRVFQPEKLTESGAFEELERLNPDLIVVVAYGQILKKTVLDLPRLGCVNIHSSLLPRWRGAAPIQWAILRGDQKTGVTTMKIIPKLDAGDIYLQEETPIGPTDDGQMIHDRLAALGGELIQKTIEQLESGDLQPRSQDESAVTYAPKLTKEMEILDTTKTAVELDRQVRALNPWPGTSVVTDLGQRLKIKRAILHESIAARPGEIFEKNGMILLGTALGALELQRLQWEGRKPTDAAGFINGIKSQKGTIEIKLRMQP